MEVSTILWITGGVCAVLLGAGLFEEHRARERRSAALEKFKEKLASRGFKAGREVSGVAGPGICEPHGVILNDSATKLCFWRSRLEKPDDFSATFVSYKDIIAAEIYEDGGSITKTQRGSQLGGALVGGVLLGGVGAVIGGLSGSKRSVEEVSDLRLRLIVNDTTNPTREVIFIRGGQIKKSNPIYEALMQAAREWYGIAEVLMKRADSESRAVAASPAPSGAPLVADELKKLGDLVSAGLLTKAEFEQQKQAMLRRSQ